MAENVKYKVTAIKYSLFRDVTQRRSLISYQRFRTTYRSRLQLSSSTSDNPSVTTLLSVHSRVVVVVVVVSSSSS